MASFKAVAGCVYVYKWECDFHVVVLLFAGCLLFNINLGERKGAGALYARNERQTRI